MGVSAKRGRRVLVTGGSGFIGSHVVDKLRASGHEPVIYDLRASPHHEPGEIETRIGDLLDTESVREAMADCDAVVHLAAAADVGEVAERPESSERLNAQGTISVLQAARDCGIERVVYGSTVWVYGESGEGVIDEEAPLGLPKHLYTASKLAGEMYCASYAELYGVDYTILRFGIPYGPRARPAAVLPIFVRKALAGEALTIAGDGSQTRTFIYVEDLAEGIVRGLERGRSNRVYNLAGEETTTIKELAETVRDLVGEVEIEHTPGRGGDYAGARISSARAADELGWRAATPFAEGARRYLAWHRADQAEPAAAAAPAAPAPEEEPREAAPVASGSLREAGRMRRWRPLGLGIGGLQAGFAACTVATLVPFLLALRSDDFDRLQADAAALTTLAATLIVLTLVQGAIAGRVANALRTAGWLTVGYFALMAPPIDHRLKLALPEWQTLVLSAIGTVVALVVAFAVGRWVEEPVSDEIR
jgi:UDP-glucose 4-epimerase